MKNLTLLLKVFLLSVSGLAQMTPQPKPGRVPRPQRPTAVTETSREPVYIPLDPTAAPCQMTVADAPTINGVKLGLTPDELGKAFKIKITPGAPNAVEVSTFSVEEKNKSALPSGINSIYLNFFSNRLYSAKIDFDNASPKKTLDKFALALSEKYKFSKAWFRTAAVVNDVYLFCPRELWFEINSRNEDVLQLQMTELKTLDQVIQKRKEINRSKPQ